MTSAPKETLDAHAIDPGIRRKARAEAGEWLLSMTDRPLAPDEQTRFEAWLAAAPAHKTAFNEMSATWGDIAELQHLRPLADPSPAPPLWRRALDAVANAIPRPRPALAGMMLAAALAAAFVYLPPFLDRPNAQYTTEIAELETITLSDGSVVTLGANSRIEEHFSERERRVTLVSGDAFFEVARSPDRPFFVDAGAATVRVTGTKFDVRRRSAGVDVAVLEGEVHVGEDRHVTGERVRILRPGQRVEVIERPALLGVRATLQPISNAGAVPAGDWRGGRLTYDGARLADVAADINRYYAPGFSVSADASDILVTASFKATEIEGFLATLDVALPVEMTRHRNGSFSATARS